MKRHLVGGLIAIFVIGFSAAAVRSQSSSVNPDTRNRLQGGVAREAVATAQHRHHCGWRCSEEHQRVQLGMLDGAWTGEFEFLGHQVHRMKPKDRVELNKKYIGFVFQSYHLIDNLTVYENLDIPLSYRNVKGSERASIVCDALDRFHIVGKRDLYPSQLSGGQQQLVAVARAVIANPKLILADEPTGNLHSSQGKEIMELFKKLNEEGATIVQVTHSHANAEYGNRLIQLADGWVTAGGSDVGQAPA